MPMGSIMESFRQNTCSLHLPLNSFVQVHIVSELLIHFSAWSCMYDLPALPSEEPPSLPLYGAYFPSGPDPPETSTAILHHWLLGTCHQPKQYFLFYDMLCYLLMVQVHLKSYSHICFYFSKVALTAHVNFSFCNYLTYLEFIHSIKKKIRLDTSHHLAGNYNNLLLFSV